MFPKPCLSLKRSNTIGKRLVRAKLKDVTDPPKSTEKMAIHSTPDLTGNSGGCATPAANAASPCLEKSL